MEFLKLNFNTYSGFSVHYLISEFFRIFSFIADRPDAAAGTWLPNLIGLLRVVRDEFVPV